MFLWIEDGTGSNEVQEEGGSGVSPEDEDFEQFSPQPRQRRHSQSSRRSSRSSRQSRRSQTSRASKESPSGEQARQKFADRTSMGSAFSAASIFETYRPRESENGWQICRPLALWIVSIVATTGISVPMYSVGDFVLTEGSFGYDTQVSDPGISQLQRWRHAARLTKRDVGLGLSTDLPDTLNDNVTWRRVALIYQLPGQDAVSDVGLQRAKAVEDSLRSLRGWQRLCGEMPASYQGLCREGDSLVSASFAMRAQVSPSQVALGVSAELALNANSSQASIKMETLARIMEEQAPGTLDRWLPKDEFGMHSYFAFRSSFAFALRVDSAAASWAELILEEVEPLLLDLGVLSVAREEQDDLRVYLEADNLPQIQANELRRSMSEDLPLLVFGPLSAFLATLLRGRLLVALTAAVLAFAVPVIASLGILGRRDELLEGVEVRIVATAAWFLVAAGVADLSAACAHAMEERRESLRLMAPQWLLVRLLSQSAEQLQAASPPSLWRQVMACMPLEELRGHSARVLKMVRFVIEALLPTAAAGLMLLLLSMRENLELVANFAAHAGMGLILCAPLTALMVPAAVEAGDAIAARVQAWREASDLELSDALQTVFDNTFPFELGAKQDLAMDLKLKMRKRMRDYLRVRWSLIGVSLILGGLVLAYIVTFLLRDAANFTAQTPQLFEAGHRLHEKAEILARFDFPGEYETPLREVPKLARRCFPWADTAAECTWHQCEAEEKTSSAEAEELDECTCYHKQESIGCNGSAARLFGPNASQVQAILQQGIFWRWVGDRLGRTFSEDATAVQKSFLELEVWLTGGLQLDAGLHSEVGGAVWDSACLQVLCYCGGLQCRSAWGSLLGALAMGNLNITAPSPAAEPPGAASSNSSQQGTVDLVVTWGIQVSSEPLSADLGRGIEFSSQLLLEDLQTQRRLLAFCEGTDPELIILRRRCWPIEFKRWLTDRGSYYPVPSELFYPFLRTFFQEHFGGPASQGSVEEDLGGFWLTAEGTATALYFTFEVVPEADGTYQALQLEDWQEYAGLRAGSSGNLGQAWLPPTSAVLEQGQIATAAVVEQSARFAGTFCILFPAVLVLLVTWSCGLALVTSLLLALAAFVIEFHNVRVSQQEVGVLDIVSLIAYSTIITLGLLRAAMHVAWCQDGSGRDPQLKKRKGIQAQKIGLLSVLMGICSEEGDGRPTFLLRSLSSDLAAKPPGEEAQIRRSVEDLMPDEQKALLRVMDNLNSPFVSLTGLRHERLGRASRGSCRAGQEVFTTFVALVIGSAPILFTSLTGIAKVCMAGLLGGVVSVLLLYCCFPVLMMLGFGPSRVKQRAFALFAWWLLAGRPRPTPEKAPPGLADTDLGSLGQSSAEVLGPPFSWMAGAQWSKEQGGDEATVPVEQEVVIKNLDLQGATAAPPFHVASVFLDKFSGSG